MHEAKFFKCYLWIVFYMNLKIFFVAIFIFLTNGCGLYSVKDYGSFDKGEGTICVNMEPAQQILCEEDEQRLQIGLGADEDCNHPYEYERKRCKNEKEIQKKL
ncbi:hypothetical protein AB4140_18735 [Shewanella sp. 10N.286.51.B2]|uniref:hypothetical protein n=1 Tax=Shewanella sp. 10N.286.51.B2 TaxID=3229707 RepID=UPI00354F7099